MPSEITIHDYIPTDDKLHILKLLHRVQLAQETPIVAAIKSMKDKQRI